MIKNLKCTVNVTKGVEKWGYFQAKENCLIWEYDGKRLQIEPCGSNSLRFGCIKGPFILFRLHGFRKVCITPKKFSKAEDSSERDFETCGPNEYGILGKKHMKF